MCFMGASLTDLSGSDLRKLALGGVREFIVLLDEGKTEELQHKKAYLSEIFARLTEKEQEELQHLMPLVSKIADSSLLQKTS
jgi:predicted house-cleaning noncanonical NTP pyrophosphatase (MazG superfamily)